MSPPFVDHIRKHLESALKDAMRAKDRAAITALRGLLHAIDNASAVEVADSSAASEVPRRIASREEIVSLIRREAEERHAAARLYESVGESLRAQELRRQAEIASTWVDLANND